MRYENKEEQKNVYLDLDGCVVNFDGKLHELFGKKYEEIKHEMAVGDIWDKLGDVDHLFLNLEPYPQYKTLFNYLKKLKTDDKINKLEILTSIPHPTKKLKTAREDKIAWVRKYLDPDIVVNTVMGGAKKAKFASGPNDILIDDLERNITEWEKAGGTGVLFKANGSAISRLDQLLHLNIHKSK